MVSVIIMGVTVCNYIVLMTFFNDSMSCFSYNPMKRSKVPAPPPPPKSLEVLPERITAPLQMPVARAFLAAGIGECLQRFEERQICWDIRTSGQCEMHFRGENV